MVYNNRLLLNPNDEKQWLFEINDAGRLMYSFTDSAGWIEQKSTGISGVTAFDVCLTDEVTPCIVCLEQQGRLSCIVYKENKWNYFPTAAIPSNTTPEFLNIFCANDLLYVYSGFRREDGKLYTFCASRSSDTWNTFKPSTSLYDKSTKVLATLPYQDGLLLALQHTDPNDVITVSFMYMTETKFDLLYDPLTCEAAIQSLYLFQRGSTEDVCALWAENNRCRFVRNGNLIHDRVLSVAPSEIYCDANRSYYIKANNLIYNLRRDLNLGDQVPNSMAIPLRQTFSHNGTVKSYIGIDSANICLPNPPTAGVASVAEPIIEPPNDDDSPSPISPLPTVSQRPMPVKKKQPKGMNNMSETVSLEDRIVALEEKYHRLEKISAALSEQVKHFRTALLQTEDYMQQRDKALYRLESAIGHPLTPKKSTVKNTTPPIYESDSNTPPPVAKPPKDGERIYSGMDGLYIINNKKNNN